MPATIARPQSSSVSASAGAARIEPLDWTKGALVLVMVVYHSINYSIFRPVAFQYLPFLPPSFVMIAGFVVGAIYAARYDLRTWSPYARLLVRGLKLLLLFTVLNIGFCVLLERDLIAGGYDFAERSGMIFVSGNGREGIFEVLLPIAYVLLLMPALLWLRGRSGYVIPGCALALFVLNIVMERRGLSSVNLMLLSAGVLGMAFGLVPLAAVDRFARNWAGVLWCYLLYHLCSWRLGEIYPVQMFGAAATVLLLYACALRLDMSAWAGRQLVRLGRYSLLGYLAQIALIRLMVPLLGGKPEHWGGVIVVGMATTLVLCGIVGLVNRLRRWHRPVDAIYKFVFA